MYMFFKKIVITIEFLSVALWIVTILFSLLFLDAPNAKFSDLRPLYLPFIATLIISFATYFRVTSRSILLLSLILSLLISVPAIFFTF